jgi:hypothetical protein
MKTLNLHALAFPRGNGETGVLAAGGEDASFFGFDFLVLAIKRLAPFATLGLQPLRSSQRDFLPQQQIS